jgi:hypothetical protein
VTLYPGASVSPGESRVVSFGLPFPRGVLADASAVRVLDEGGTELPLAARELATWWAVDNLSASVRAVLIQTEVAVDVGTTLSIEYGSVTSAVELSNPPTPTADWVAIAVEERPDEYAAVAGVMEPAVYATLPAEWLSRCAFRGTVEPVGTTAAWGWYDEAQLAFGRTAVNDVDPRVTASNLIQYETTPSPWLYDRTMSLYSAYLRTGDVYWLRRGHRSAQFYRAHLTSEGYFDLKANDLKYSFGQSLLTDMLLTGDESAAAHIEAVAEAGASWDPQYTFSRGFWTERNQTYALLAALSAWEMTGETTHLDRVREIVTASIDVQRNPPQGWTRDGCVLHTGTAASEGGGTTPVCSPWMSALLAEAIWRYYQLTQDTEALEFLAELGHYVRDLAIYEVPAGNGNLSRSLDRPRARL